VTDLATPELRLRALVRALERKGLLTEAELEEELQALLREDG
jgi:hypothetical protein